MFFSKAIESITDIPHKLHPSLKSSGTKIAFNSFPMFQWVKLHFKEIQQQYGMYRRERLCWQSHRKSLWRALHVLLYAAPYDTVFQTYFPLGAMLLGENDI